MCVMLDIVAHFIYFKLLPALTSWSPGDWTALQKKKNKKTKKKKVREWLFFPLLLMPMAISGPHLYVCGRFMQKTWMHFQEFAVFVVVFFFAPIWNNWICILCIEFGCKTSHGSEDCSIFFLLLVHHPAQKEGQGQRRGARIHKVPPKTQTVQTDWSSSTLQHYLWRQQTVWLLLLLESFEKRRSDTKYPTSWVSARQIYF